MYVYLYICIYLTVCIVSVSSPSILYFVILKINDFVCIIFSFFLSFFLSFFFFRHFSLETDFYHVLSHFFFLSILWLLVYNIINDCYSVLHIFVPVVTFFNKTFP